MDGVLDGMDEEKSRTKNGYKQEVKIQILAEIIPGSKVRE